MMRTEKNETVGNKTLTLGREINVNGRTMKVVKELATLPNIAALGWEETAIVQGSRGSQALAQLAAKEVAGWKRVSLIFVARNSMAVRTEDCVVSA